MQIDSTDNEKKARITALLDATFGPRLTKLKQERELLQSYYESELPASRFCVSRNIGFDSLMWTLKKHSLPRRLKDELSDPRLFQFYIDKAREGQSKTCLD